MLVRLQIDDNCVVDAADEELDTVVQGMDGIDYVLMLDHGSGIKYWGKYTTQHFTEEEILADTMQPLETALRHIARVEVNTKKRGRPPGRTSDTSVEKPKRPHQPNGYIGFMSTKLKELTITHPSLTNKDRMALVASMWQQLKG